MYSPVGVLAGTSSFDITPAKTLDPNLFDGDHLRPSVRMTLLSFLVPYLDAQYAGRDQWLRAWMAGSGASYRWHAAQDLKDLDILLGVDFVNFRRSNPAYSRLGNAEIASMMNERMRTELWPVTADWGGYEVTWYVNARSQDIRSINPYAAYDLLQDVWAVAASKNEPNVAPEWQQYAAQVQGHANTAIERYSQAWSEVQHAQSPAHRANAERHFHMAVENAVNIFDTVHEGRRAAFSPTGGGYDDPANYLWQAGKKAGWIPALRQIKQYHQQTMATQQVQTYGVELPDSDTLVRRALLHRGVS